MHEYVRCGGEGKSASITFKSSCLKPNKVSGRRRQKEHNMRSVPLIQLKRAKELEAGLNRETKGQSINDDCQIPIARV